MTELSLKMVEVFFADLSESPVLYKMPSTVTENDMFLRVLAKSSSGLQDIDDDVMKDFDDNSGQQYKGRYSDMANDMAAVRDLTYAWLAMTWCHARTSQVSVFD